MRETFLYQINVTRDCNLRCSHCYIHSDSKRASKSMSEDRFLDVMRQIRDHMLADQSYKHAEIHIIGGEPTMLGLAYFVDVLPKARAILSEISQAVSFRLVTNLLSEDSVEIARLFEMVSTSYEVESRFNKPALEQRWVDRVRQLQGEGRNIAVTTAMTRPVIRHGAAKLLSYFSSLGLKQAHLGFFVPAGDALDNMEALEPTHEETSQYLIDATDWYLANREHDKDLCINPIESMLAAVENGKPVDDIVCPIISGSVDVNWDGNAVSCIQAGGAKSPEWLGNVFEVPIMHFVKSLPFRRTVVEAVKPRRHCYGCDEYQVCMSACGVLHKSWDEQGECPGYKRFIKHIRSLYESGVRSRTGSTAMADRSSHYQVQRR